MTTILLTWNPDQFHPYQNQLPLNWSTGNRVRGLTPGDHAYLLRQGTHGRGLVARAEITSEIYYDVSWRDSSDGFLPTVNVQWLDELPVSYAVSIEQLYDAIPSVSWNCVLASGQNVTAESAMLDRVWRQAVSAYRHETPVVSP